MHRAQLTMQLGHKKAINSVSISKDGSLVLTASDDYTARLWATTSGKELRRFEGHTDRIFSAALSPDNRYVLTGSRDRTSRLWDTTNGKEIRHFEGDGLCVLSVAFSPDGQQVLTGCNDHTARLWDTASGKEIRRFEGHTDIVYAVAFSPDGRSVLTGSWDRTARVWDITTGRELHRFEQADKVLSVAFSPNGHYVLTGANDDTVRLWDTASGKELRRFVEYLSNRATSVTFSPDGHSVTAGGSYQPQVWDLDTGEEFLRLGELTPGHSICGNMNSVVFSPDSRSVVAGCEDGTAHRFDITRGRDIRRYGGDTDAISQTVFSSDGHLILIGSLDHTARLWDAARGNELLRFVGHTEDLFSVAISPDDRFVLTNSADSARLWDATTGKQLHRFEWNGEIMKAGFSPDSRYAVLGGGDILRADSVMLWDIKERKEFRTIQGVKGSGRGPTVFSADSRYMVTCDGFSSIQLWEVASGQNLGTVKSNDKSNDYRYVRSLSVSPDGHDVILGYSDLTSQKWDTTSGELRDIGQHPENGSGVKPSETTLSENHRLELVRDKDNIQLVDTTSGKTLHTFEALLPADPNAFNNAALSPDNRYVLTGQGDGTTTLWDSRNGDELATLVSFRDNGWAVVDPDGRYDASDPDSSSSLYWVTDNLRVIELGQLKKEYYTPGLLGRIMRGEHLPDVTGMNTAAAPPQLSVSQNFSPSTKSLTVIVKNEGGGVGKVLVRVNGRLVSTTDNPGNAPEGKSLTLRIDLSNAPFTEGDNLIRVTAYDAENRIESQEALARYRVPPAIKGFRIDPVDTALDAGKFYAIVVGTSTFGDPKMDLAFPARDARNLAKGIQLGAERLYGKDRIWMRVLTSDASIPDALPTKANIRDAFNQVRKNARPEDTLLVYFSGHGTMSNTDRDLYYYLTMDARTFDIEQDPKLRDVSTISSRELFQWLREPLQTMPLKQVVILDTCAAGGASDALSKLGEKREISPDQRRAIELLKDATGTYILMGSAADSVSYEASRYGEGLLTYALLEDMRLGPLEDGSRLGVSQWFESASERVPELAKSIGGIQQPVIAAPKGTGFPIAMLTPVDRAGIPVALPKPQLLRVVCEDDNQDDPLNLKDPLREQLRAVNDLRSRGDERQESPVIYIDATDDDLPGALAPKLLYTVMNGTVSIRIRLVEDRKTVAEETVTANPGDPQLPTVLATKLISMAAATKPQP
jgi:WD40 repeat protein